MLLPWEAMTAMYATKQLPHCRNEYSPGGHAAVSLGQGRTSTVLVSESDFALLLTRDHRMVVAH